jgi:hypothetical protein
MAETLNTRALMASGAKEPRGSNANLWKPLAPPTDDLAQKAVVEAKRRQAHARRRVFLARKKEAYATASIVDNLLTSVVRVPVYRHICYEKLVYDIGLWWDHGWVIGRCSRAFTVVGAYTKNSSIDG